MTNPAASILRENTETSGIVETARTAAVLLAEHEIPHLEVGGLAVPPAVRALYLETWDALAAEK